MQEYKKPTLKMHQILTINALVAFFVAILMVLLFSTGETLNIAIAVSITPFYLFSLYAIAFVFSYLFLNQKYHEKQNIRIDKENITITTNSQPYQFHQSNIVAISTHNALFSLFKLKRVTIITNKKQTKHNFSLILPTHEADACVLALKP